MKPTAINYDLDQLNAFAWKATCEWHLQRTVRYGSFDADYIELTRWFLWDKVGRAIRESSGLRSTKLEHELIKTAIDSSSNSTFETNFYRHCLLPYLSRIGSLIKKKTERHVPPTNIKNFQRSPGPLIYVPVLSDRLKNAAGELIRKNICQVIVCYSQRTLEGVCVFEPIIDSLPDHDAATSVFKAITEGLQEFGITLLAGDAQLLQFQILQLTTQAKAAQTELEILQPDAILVHGDNHPPFQAYVLAAKKMGIPAIMLQHGLDCEHHYLDEAYASEIAVWGPQRLRRYREKSNWQPKISVTGNPEYDQLRLPAKIDFAGGNWLWATRPHTPEKCYSPSRNPEEGLTIFYALIEALKKAPEAKLVIKPHPCDYHDLYCQIILAQGLHGRVTVSLQNINDLIPLSSLVISEDSSAGLDAMFSGKPLIHAHFAESKPTMPFVDYGAALPGFSKEQLVESIMRVSAFEDSEAQKFFSGQIDFIRDFAGPCDGSSCNRFVEFVSEILCQK